MRVLLFTSNKVRNMSNFIRVWVSYLWMSVKLHLSCIVLLWHSDKLMYICNIVHNSANRSNLSQWSTSFQVSIFLVLIDCTDKHNCCTYLFKGKYLMFWAWKIIYLSYENNQWFVNSKWKWVRSMQTSFIWVQISFKWEWHYLWAAL